MLVPWQRKQFSYWLTAGLTTVFPSVALIPITCSAKNGRWARQGRTRPGWSECGLWQSTRATDAVGRWGGDEFLVVLDGNLTEAQSHVERMRKWVFGSYTLHLGTERPRLKIENIAIGLVERRPRETLKEVLARADTLMYKQKAEMRKGSGTPASTRMN